jgi:hypothetical protein
MPVTVIRVYGTHEAAENAVKELKRQRFSASDVHLVRAPEEGADAVPAIQEAGVSKYRAERFAGALTHGGALVVVHPPFGNAALAEEVLDHFEPVTTHGIPSHEYDLGTDYEDDATPFSRLLGWKVLLRNNPAPFSDALGWSTLKKPGAHEYAQSTPGKLLGGSAAPLSNTLGLKILTENPAPLSSSTGMKTLSSDPAPFSRLLGLKTLTGKQTVLGDTKLSHDPAPLSHALGLPVLTKNQR